MAHFGEMNSVWDSWVSPGNTPTRATVQSALAGRQYKVEIMVEAAAPSEGPRRRRRRLGQSQGQEEARPPPLGLGR